MTDEVQAAGEGDLADAPEARRRAALDLVEAPQGDRGPHVPPALHRHGSPRRTACLRLRAAARVAADQRPRRPHPRRRGRVREAELRPGRAGGGLDLDRLPERADPLLLVPERRVRRYPRPEHECDPGDAVDPPRLASAPQRAVRPPGDAVGRLAGRPLLPAGDDLGRPDRLRAGDPPAEGDRRAQGRGRPVDEHVAGLQLPRRDGRRLGRLVVHRRRGARGRPAPSVPRRWPAVSLPRVELRLPLVAPADGQGGRLALGRRPRQRGERGRPSQRLRPRRLPRPRGVRHRARLRRGPALPGPSAAT